MNPAAELIRSARFRAEREPDWRRLEAIVTRAERRGIRALGLDEAQSLASLYRQATASLALAREISLDKALLAYLEALCARAYLVVYAPQERLGGLLPRLLVRGIPGAARRLFPLILIAAAILSLGVAVGYLLFLDDPGWYDAIMPASLVDGRGLSAGRDELLSVIYPSAAPDSGQLGAFASFLFSHNTRIAMLVFCLGVFAGIPGAVLTFYNGVILGVFVALHADRGILPDILAWLAIHGVTELSAVIVACAGGLHLGQAVVFPGDLRRRDALRYNSRDAVKLALLAALMLVAAAVLEGFGRQLIRSPEWRLATGLGAGLAWLAWLGLAGRRAR